MCACIDVGKRIGTKMDILFTFGEEGVAFDSFTIQSVQSMSKMYRKLFVIVVLLACVLAGTHTAAGLIAYVCVCVCVCVYLHVYVCGLL